MCLLHLYTSIHAQIAIICWANAGILTAVLLARRRQMTLARCQPLVRCWSNARNPTSPAYANVLPMYCQPFSRVGPTFARNDVWAESININSLGIFDFPYTLCYWLQQFIS